MEGTDESTELWRHPGFKKVMRLRKFQNSLLKIVYYIGSRSHFVLAVSNCLMKTHSLAIILLGKYLCLLLMQNPPFAFCLVLSVCHFACLQSNSQLTVSV